MKTRTLLLLALGCGLMIMLAGAVFLFQLSTRDDVTAPVPIGRQASVADMQITVRGSTERGGLLDVRIVIGGVDDPDGAAGFRLIAGGRAVPSVASTDGGCRATTVGGAECSLAFDLAGVDGSSRVLFYERGEDRARWVLA
jgi:hypothetical protein